ncbi:MAG: hypothetical protein PF637_12905 [Spirochaetes bacterium]|jgi:hypothetical protein|nr:hypothetical protein [Spirochaetota bacterium]
MIETTITMEYSRYERLEKYCTQANISKTKFIVLCLNKYIPKLKKSRYRFSTTQYQKPAETWKTVHIYLNEISYEKYGDIDRLHKYTFSLMSTLAFDCYCEQILEELLGDTFSNDNGSFVVFYSVFAGQKKGNQTFSFIWGNSDENTITIKQNFENRNFILQI